MPQMNETPVQSASDIRWFVWTIVFLVVTGISLVSYIVFSDNSVNDVGYISPSKASSHKTPAPVLENQVMKK
jgi:hypothetical protein